MLLPAPDAAFPTELYELIIDLVAQDPIPPRREQTLYACALTCSAWLPRSRLHLFSSARVTTLTLPAFVASLTLNPSNGLFVRSLLFESRMATHKKSAQEPAILNLDDVDLSEFNRRRDIKAHADRLGEIDDRVAHFAADLPDRLPNVIHISLHDVDFSRLGSSFFEHLRRFRCVRSVDCGNGKVSSFEQLTRLLQSFPHLQHLCMTPWREPWLQGSSDEPDSKISIPSCHFGNSPKFGCGLGSIWFLLDPTAIVSLSLDAIVGKEEDHYIWQFLRECRPTLRHLTLTVTFFENETDDNLLLFPALQSLEFRAQYDDTSTIRGFTRLLFTASLDTLEHLHIVVENLNLEERPSLYRWASLEVALTQPPWCAVDHISIRMYTGRSVETRRTVEEHQVRALFPRFALNPNADFAPLNYTTTHPFHAVYDQYQYAMAALDDERNGRLLVPEAFAEPQGLRVVDKNLGQ